MLIHTPQTNQKARLLKNSRAFLILYNTLARISPKKYIMKTAERGSMAGVSI